MVDFQWSSQLVPGKSEQKERVRIQTMQLFSIIIVESVLDRDVRTQFEVCVSFPKCKLALSKKSVSTEVYCYEQGRCVM